MKKVREDLSIALTDVSLQTTLREEARAQIDTKVADLKELQSRLAMGKNVLITMHDAQTKVAAKLE